MIGIYPLHSYKTYIMGILIGFMLGMVLLIVYIIILMLEGLVELNG
jgi:hypothetical protein